MTQDDSLRARLLEGALAEFVANGYERTHLRTIAARAGCTTGAIYGQFGSKAALLAEAIGAELERGIEALSGSRQHRPGAAPLRETTHAILSSPPTDLYALVVDAFSASRTDDVVRSLTRDRLHAMSDNHLTALVERQQRGEIDPALDPAAIRDVSMALVLGAMVLKTMGHPTAGRRQLHAVLDRLATSLEVGR